jgi:hypothetical protein
MPAQLTVVETVYYQPLDEQPTAVQSRYTRPLTSDAQPYSRTLEATESWQPLDVGWIEGAAVVILHNDEGKFPRVRPTVEERQAAAAKVLEVGRGGAADWLIPPGASMRALAAQPGQLQVRCQAGTAKFTLTLFGA